MAPRARFEIAIRRGELTTEHERSADPLTSFARLEFPFTAHSSRTCWKSFAVEQLPRASVALGVESQSAIGVIMLGEAVQKVAGLAHISLAFGVGQYVDVKGQGVWLPGLDSN